MSKHFNATLIHTCTVQRPTESQSDTGEVVLTYTTLSTGVLCRLVQKMERYASEGSSVERVQVHRLLVKPDEDIEPGDKVTAFAWYSTGEATGAGTFAVLNRLERNTKALHHISLELEKVGA